MGVAYGGAGFACRKGPRVLSRSAGISIHRSVDKVGLIAPDLTIKEDPGHCPTFAVALRGRFAVAVR